MAPLLEAAGFTMQGDRDKMNTWLHELTDICERPIRNDSYDWGACRMSADCRDHFGCNVGTMLRCRAPTEGLMFYRAAAGAAGDFRMLRSNGDFRTVLQNLADTAWTHMDPALRAACGEAGLPAPRSSSGGPAQTT